MKCILIDDERLARKELRRLLESHADAEIIGEAANADEGIELIEKLKPDLIFLDVQMPEKTGFQMLEELSFTPFVIFTTAYDKYALKAFEVSALDYLMKPVQISRLQEALEKVRQVLKKTEATGTLSENDRIFLKDGDKCIFVELSAVRMISGEGNYARLFFNGQQMVTHKSLNKIEERLNKKVFFRANRKQIINVKFIKSIEPYFNNTLIITLADDSKIEVSRNNSMEFKDIMSL